MKNVVSSLLVIVMLFTLLPVATVLAATLISKSEAESMTKAGSTSNSTSPFTGVTLYSNGDLVKNNANFSTIPGRYEIKVSGASSNSSAAGISVYVGGVKKASLSFSGTAATIQSALFNITSGVTSQEVQLKLETDNGQNDTRIDYYELYFDSVPPPPPAAPIPSDTGAYSSDIYRNMFKEWGKTDTEINNKVDGAFQQLFYGDDANQRIYYPVGTDMAYIKDTGNNDVRSEGMSYGMMIAVQMNKKAEFDRLWKWAKTYMQNTSGSQEGFFAWQVSTSGSKIDVNPASDGEEYFITSLLFAANRWGNGSGIFNYGSEAQVLLDKVLALNGHNVRMFDQTQKQVVFVPIGSAATYSDPSYHLPAFYELWALWDNDNNQLWRDTATKSRAFFALQANSTTGLGPDYAEFSGAPNNTGNHGDFRFDAWRTIMNVAMDYNWFAKDSWQKTYVNKLQNFFYNQGMGAYANQYSLSGTALSTDHSPGLVATNAVGSLAATDVKAWDFIAEFWNTQIPTGQYRYYDGCLYLMSLLHVSGQFKIYKPDGGTPPPSDTTAPTAPTNVTAPSKTANSVTLSWTASTDTIGVTGYDIYRGGTILCGTSTSTAFSCSGLTGNTSYTFTVKAKDAAGNVSAASNSVTVTTSVAVVDTTAPTAPTSLTAPSKTDTSVSLSWSASTDSVGVTGYDIYRGGTILCGTSIATTFTCDGLSANTSYSFTVKAKDAAGNISAASNSVSVTTNAASSGGTVLWSDSFEAGSGSWSNYNGNWSVITDGTKVYSSGGVYDTGMARVESQTWSNSKYEARVKVAATNSGNLSNVKIGIAGRVQNQSNFYIAYFDGSKNIKLAKVVNGTWTTLGTYAGNYTEGTFHTVMLDMTSTAIKVSVNGTQRISVTDSQFSSGKIAVYADRATGRFDDVKIYQ